MARWWPALVVAVLLLTPVSAQQPPAEGPAQFINQLSALDAATRTNAARQLRRMPRDQVFPALATAVTQHQDQFVRARALVLLSAFGPVGVPDAMQRVMNDRNDRLRETAYRWFELNAERRHLPVLLTAFNSEQAEFVRPALIRALAALAANEPPVQRMLIMEVGRGVDFFRSAVIDALGAHRAAYAVQAIAQVAVMQGPLQDDAVLALGRIGGPQAGAALSTFTSPPLELIPALQAALCLIGDQCTVRIRELEDAVRTQTARPELQRAAVRALGDIGSARNAMAMTSLIRLGAAQPIDPAIAGNISVALATVALRQPLYVIDLLTTAPDESRALVVQMLRDGFASLEEEFAEEQFYAAARGVYWAAPENSAIRIVTANLIDKLEF